VKILTFLKGGTMKIQFNEAQLSRAQQKSLIEVLDVLQAENKNELVVTPVEFPLKLRVKLDDDIEMLLGWDAEKQGYAGLTKPEPEPDLDSEQPGSQNLTSNSTGSQTPESQKDTVDLPEPELDLSPVVVRVHALGRAFVNLIKPLNTNQRLELWIEFCKILFKELLENEVS